MASRRGNRGGLRLEIATTATTHARAKRRQNPHGPFQTQNAHLEAPGALLEHRLGLRFLVLLRLHLRLLDVLALQRRLLQIADWLLVVARVRVTLVARPAHGPPELAVEPLQHRNASLTGRLEHHAGPLRVGPLLRAVRSSQLIGLHLPRPGLGAAPLRSPWLVRSPLVTPVALRHEPLKALVEASKREESLPHLVRAALHVRPQRSPVLPSLLLAQVVAPSRPLWPCELMVSLAAPPLADAVREPPTPQTPATDVVPAEPHPVVLWLLPLPRLHLVVLRHLVPRPTGALQEKAEQPKRATLRLVEPRDLALWPLVLLRVLRGLWQLLAAERLAGQRLRSPPGRVLRLLVLVRVLVLTLLALVKLAPLGLEPERLRSLPFAQLLLVLAVLRPAGLGAALLQTPVGHDVLLAPAVVKAPLPLAGQHGYQGRDALRLPEPLYCRPHMELPRPSTRHSSVERVSDVVLHLVLRLTRYTVFARRARTGPLPRWPTVLVRPRLTRRLPLVQIHRPHFSEEVERRAEPEQP